MDRRSIIHISDLHFGRHSESTLAGLFIFLHGLPSPLRLVIVTGDLTQRAKDREFRHAADFLGRISKLGASVVVIPGNHDVSLYNPLKRFLRPFGAYDRFIGNQYPDSYEDDSLCVVGLRTNNLRSVAEGRLRRQHAEICRQRFGAAAGKLKLLAVHHPLLESLANPYAREILGTGPEMVLSGHRHRYGAVKMQVDRHAVISLSAGTAISTRTRDEENGFNWIEYSPGERRGHVRSLLLKDGEFQLQSEESFSYDRTVGADAKGPGSASRDAEGIRNGSSDIRHGSGYSGSTKPALRAVPRDSGGAAGAPAPGASHGRQKESKFIEQDEEPGQAGPENSGQPKKGRRKRA